MPSRKDHDPSMSTEAEFRWAQRKDRILITIDLQGVTDESFYVHEDGTFKFEGMGSYRQLMWWSLQGLAPAPKKEVMQNLRERESLGNLYAEVYNVTHCEVNARDVSCTLMKAKREAYWPHLLKGGKKPKNMHVDWSKWLDEDKDGVRWNDDVDRPWEWWKHDDEEDDEETEEDMRRREEQKKRFKKKKKQRGEKK
ncbi:hypothetical protein GUITHDRAFT_101171 [Guillardia theta CCMP2712]|uniref:CS domain-containing protein n=1 Tax=Guillardia theta (strain CCMP2712) TaxID=905079 RepID=L1JZ27_GUITC|nr:hypothetical protein GUITHDRAFT_101171 [Guillardia theta CCMP2712]EKX53470.1 hypothetical protein GUITHDRAFT_101171 [Guillardia theta CCMP2712]|eukprot:XP_005840450.1 hypothetical protein GUITHDRAFT_101171 [Guillardia theta CCMP2712]